MPNIGPQELIIVLVIAFILLGPKRLPDAGRSLGRGMREFKASLTGRDAEPAPTDGSARDRRRDEAEPRRAGQAVSAD